MKALWKGQLWHIEGDNGKGLFLRSMAPDCAEEPPVFASFAADGLIIEPTDGEVDGCCPTCYYEQCRCDSERDASSPNVL